MGFVVRSVTIDYLQPARLSDALDISVELLQLGASQIKLKQAVTRAGTLLCEASVRIACVSIAASATTTNTIKAVRIPRIIIESIQPA